MVFHREGRRSTLMGVRPSFSATAALMVGMNVVLRTSVVMLDKNSVALAAAFHPTRILQRRPVAVMRSIGKYRCFQPRQAPFAVVRKMGQPDEESIRHGGEKIHALWHGVLNRAERTLSYKSSLPSPSSAVENNATDESLSTLMTMENEEVDDIGDAILSDVRRQTAPPATAVDDVVTLADVVAPVVDSQRISTCLSEIMHRAEQVHFVTNQKQGSKGEVPTESDVCTSNEEEDAESSISRNRPAVVTAGDVAESYSDNPTITITALAHSLWSYVLRPDTDTAIDATAGNGGDSVAVARMLFSCTKRNSNTTTAATSQARLLAVDVQEQACANTARKLAAVLPADILRHNVQILHQSHAPLPRPCDTSSVALVVYNLGFLPSSTTKDSVATVAETTLASLADAALLLRIGGMISVVTYPRTNRDEDEAVRTFLEGLALFSSVTHDWETHVQTKPVYGSQLGERLIGTLRHVRENGVLGQTWRVHEHKKLGWIDAPILLTATRIK